jgi:Domain of unknown function (DUF222)
VGNQAAVKDLSDDDVVREVAAIGAHIAAATARLLDLVAVADERGIWGEWDARTLPQWLSWLTGMSPRQARDHAEVADRIKQWPKTRTALATGSISFCQAKAITKTEAPGFDAELARIATEATTAQLEATTRGYRRALVLNGPDADDSPHARRYLNYFYEDESFVVRGRLGRDDGAIVKTALDAAKDELYRARRDDDSPPYDQMNADALVALAQDSLASKSPGSSGDCHQVVVHVDVATLAGADGGGADIDGAGAIAPETAHRIACDASFVALLEDGDKILNIGRKSRRPTRAIRRALRARDKMCRFPGCTNARLLDAHHMIHVPHGGDTSVDNLVLLCRWHHRLVHEGGYTVAFDDSGQVIFTRPDGTIVECVAPRPSAHPSDVVAANERAGVDAYRPLEVPEEAGRRIDLDEVVDSLFFQPAQRAKLPPEIRDHYDQAAQTAPPREPGPPPGGA